MLKKQPKGNKETLMKKATHRNAFYFLQHLKEIPHHAPSYSPSYTHFPTPRRHEEKKKRARRMQKPCLLLSRH
jgi:hypothetical protein